MGDLDSVLQALNPAKYNISLSIIYDLHLVINRTPLIILEKIDTHSLQDFARYIKQCLSQSYQEFCIIVNCYICTKN